jgi:hypothetical protein
MKKKILSYVVVFVLVTIGVYLFIDHSNKTHEAKDPSTLPCHIKR